jgi:hypothetical protein
VKFVPLSALLAAIWLPVSFSPGTAHDAVTTPASGPSAVTETDPPDEETAPRVALQAGHWQAADAPDELARLRSNGTRGGGVHESEVTLRIAQIAAEILEEAGVVVDILPTTIPPRYHADLFISIHADGHNSTTATGFKVAAPRRDQTGVARDFVEVLAGSYGEATGLRRSLHVTRQMENYYAFNSRRYEHSLDPSTVAVILETGFLTSPSDRRIIVDRPELSARGIAEAVLTFLDITVPVDRSTVAATR